MNEWMDGWMDGWKEGRREGGRDRLTDEWILGCVSGIHADFAGVDDIITNLAKEREPGIEII